MKNRLGIVTCRQFPKLYVEDHKLVAELARLGIESIPIVWDESDAWRNTDALLIRSPWDYHLKPAQFTAWLQQIEVAGPTLWNPPHIVRWNMHKFYLRELEQRGVEVVPSEWIPRGAALDLRAALERRGWREAVLKPAISANAADTFRVLLEDAATLQARASDVIQRGECLLQPFLHEIATLGEWSLIFIEGELSHAVIKLPASGDFRVQSTYGGNSFRRGPSDALAAFGRKVLAAVPERLLYARVDVIAGPWGFWLGELEIIEPSLFFENSDEAPARVAAAVERRLASLQASRTS